MNIPSVIEQSNLALIMYEKPAQENWFITNSGVQTYVTEITTALVSVNILILMDTL